MSADWKCGYCKKEISLSVNNVIIEGKRYHIKCWDKCYKKLKEKKK